MFCIFTLISVTNLSSPQASDGSILVGSYRLGQLTVHKPKHDKTLEHVKTVDTGTYLGLKLKSRLAI